MIWMAPSEKDTSPAALEKRLRGDEQLSANSGLKPQEYSQPDLGLIFLGFAEVPQDATDRFAFVLANGSMSVSQPGEHDIPQRTAQGGPIISL